MPAVELVLANPTISLPGLQILEHLGSGASGEVFRVLGDDGREKAVKVLGSGGFSRLERLRFLREFEVLSQLDHPHVLRVFEFNEQIPCFTMELVNGVTLEKWLKDRGPQGLLEEPDWTAFQQLVMQILEALGALHQAGIIHRDLKPANLMVAENGQAKLMDFGLAHMAEKERLTTSGAILGTPLYLAPELLAGNAPDPRVDLYSLGMVLYEACGGELPRAGRGLMAFLQTLLNWSPRPLNECNPRVGNGWSELVARLMAREPSLRPVSAQEAHHQIQSLRGGADPVPSRSGPRILEAAMVGREAEQARLQVLLEGLGQGQGFLLVVSGEPGIGKSRFLEDARQNCLRLGLSVYLTTCLEGDPVPYAAFLPLLRQAVQKAKKSQLSLQTILGSSAGLLARVLPELASELSAPPNLDPQSERSRFYELVVRLLETLRNQPCIFCFDDMQWADEASLDLFRYVSGRLRLESGELPPQATILLHRSDEVPPGHPLHSVVDTLARALPRETLHLGYLTQGQVEQAVLSILGGVSLSAEVSEHLYQASGGNPLYLSELVRGLVQDRQIQSDSGAWRWVESISTTSDRAQSMSGLVERRLRQLPERTLELLTAAAILGKKFRFNILASMVEGWDENEIFSRLEELLRARLLTERPSDGRDVLAFYHDRFREVVLARSSGPRYQKLHRQAASAYERSSIRDASHADVMARHYLEGGDPESACVHLRAAAVQARVSYAARQALGYYRQLQQLGDSSAEVEEALADMLFQVGDASGAIERYAALIARESDPLRRCSLEERRCLALRFQGRLAESLEGYLAAFQTLGVKIPRSKMGLQATYFLKAPRMFALMLRPRSPLPNAPSSADPLERLYDRFTSNALAWMGDRRGMLLVREIFARQYLHAMKTGRPEQICRVVGVAACGIIWEYWRLPGALSVARNLCRICREIAQGIPDPTFRSRAYRDAGWTLLQLSEVSDSLRYLDLALDLSRQVEDYYHTAELYQFLATARIMEGRMDLCLQAAEAGGHLARTGADIYFEGLGLAMGACARAAQGKVDEVERDCPRVEEIARQIGDPILPYVADDAWGRSLAYQGRWDEAVAHFQRGLAIAPGIFWQSDIALRLGEALGRGGDLAGLAKVLSVWGPRLKHQPRQRAAWLYLKAWLSQKQGLSAETLLVESIRLAETTGSVAFQARSQVALGQLRGDPELSQTGRALLLECEDRATLKFLEQDGCVQCEGQ